MKNKLTIDELEAMVNRLRVSRGYTPTTLHRKSEPAKSNPSGLGDVVEKIAEVTGVKKMVEKVMGGKDCGCNKRKETLNKMFPIQTNNPT